MITVQTSFTQWWRWRCRPLVACRALLSLLQQLLSLRSRLVQPLALRLRSCCRVKVRRCDSCALALTQRVVPMAAVVPLLLSLLWRHADVLQLQLPPATIDNVIERLSGDVDAAYRCGAACARDVCASLRISASPLCDAWIARSGGC
jgi:hypothetical protein